MIFRSLAILICAGTLSAHALEYPQARKETVTDEYHGTTVADPYRWLEDDQSAETKGWVRKQNEISSRLLSGISRRGEIRRRLGELLDFERISPPKQYGKHWFYNYNPGLLNHAMFMVSDSRGGEGRVLLDPNGFSADGSVSVGTFRPSEDGAFAAFSVSRGGSDWREIRVLNVATGKELPDKLEWVKFSGISWAKDGSGFYYSRFPAVPAGKSLTAKNENHKLYFHKIGEKQSEDRLVYELPEHPEWNIGGGVTDDGSYLIIYLLDGTSPKNRIHFIDLRKPEKPPVKLLDEGDATYDFIGNDGPVFYFLTDLGAPFGKVLAIDARKPARADRKELIPAGKDTLEDVAYIGGKFICSYLRDASSRVAIHGADGKFERGLELPGIGSVGGFSGRKKDRKTFYGFSGFTDPGAVYELDPATGKSVLWRKSAARFDGSPFVTRQVFIASKDGTKIPMFLVHRKNLVSDGKNPVLLYGYGGFRTSLTPGFSVARALWLEMGGVLAIANIRGGGEYGQEWHLAATKVDKQRSFDDFIACGEWLAGKSGISSPGKLAIQGGSNGGLLVGACMTQRPELFAAALPGVGVMDMLRFHKFTIGRAWTSDYGSPEDPQEFKALLAYSPYHNLKPGTRYPATLVTTADHDDRVVPAHSFKFAARLQECQAENGPPVIIRVETAAGHGAGTSLAKYMDLAADEWAFLVKTLGMAPEANHGG